MTPKQIQLKKQVTLDKANVVLNRLVEKVVPRFGWTGWEKIGCIDVYLRLCQRYLNGKIVSTFDLANVTVGEKYQNCGIFTAFLEKVEATAKKMNRTLYVESVQTQRFADFFRKRGYQEIDQGGFPSFFSPV